MVLSNISSVSTAPTGFPAWVISTSLTERVGFSRSVGSNASPTLLFPRKNGKIVRSEKTVRAHSKMLLRIHGMDEVRVRFPVGPPLRSLDDSGASRRRHTQHFQYSIGTNTLRSGVPRSFVTRSFSGV